MVGSGKRKLVKKKNRKKDEGERYNLYGTIKKDCNQWFTHRMG
jgi:hypothetical protein